MDTGIGSALRELRLTGKLMGDIAMGSHLAGMSKRRLAQCGIQMQRLQTARCTVLICSSQKKLLCHTRSSIEYRLCLDCRYRRGEYHNRSCQYPASLKASGY